MKEDLEKAVKNRTKYDVEGLLVSDTLKYFADGTFSMIEPYVEGDNGKEPGTREPLLWDEGNMMESMANANKEGFNIHTHAMGSYAVSRVIDFYENAQKQYRILTLETSLLIVHLSHRRTGNVWAEATSLPAFNPVGSVPALRKNLSWYLIGGKTW